MYILKGAWAHGLVDLWSHICLDSYDRALRDLQIDIFIDAYIHIISMCLSVNRCSGDLS